MQTRIGGVTWSSHDVAYPLRHICTEDILKASLQAAFQRGSELSFVRYTCLLLRVAWEMHAAWVQHEFVLFLERAQHCIYIHV